MKNSLPASFRSFALQNLKGWPIYWQKLFKRRDLLRIPMLKVLLFFVTIFCSSSSFAASSQPLSIQEAQNIALSNKFKLLPTSNINPFGPSDKNLAFHTHLTFDTEDLSPNTLVPNQPDMTLVKVGVKRALIHDNSSKMKSQHQEAAVSANQKDTENQQRLLQRDVRRTWLELYYWQQATDLLQSQLKILNQTLASLNSTNSHAHHHQEAISEVQLLANQLQNTQITIQKKIDANKNKLAQAIGKPNSQRPLSSTLPTWPDPDSLVNLQVQLINHPKLQADAAKVQETRAEIAWDKERLKPTFEIGASYGMRQQDALNADPKLDMIGGEISLHLPSSTSQMEDQDTIAGFNQLAEAKQQQLIDGRNLLKQLNQQYMTWQQLALQTAPINPTTDTVSRLTIPLPPLTTTPLTPTINQLRGQIKQLNTALLQLSYQVDLAQARSDLLYFAP